jgi:hypothetical protein
MKIFAHVFSSCHDNFCVFVCLFITFWWFVKLYNQICPSKFCLVFTHHVLTICEIISSNLSWQVFVFMLIHHVLTLHEIIQSNLSWQFFVFMLIHHVLILCEIIQSNLSCEFLCKFVCCLIIMLHSTICVFVLSYHFARHFEFCIVLSSCNNQFALVRYLKFILCDNFVR